MKKYNIEYGIAKQTFKGEEIHIDGMTKEEAEGWISEWLAYQGASNIYYIVSREVSDWDLAE